MQTGETIISFAYPIRARGPVEQKGCVYGFFLLAFVVTRFSGFGSCEPAEAGYYERNG
jgi:hypothetical protein